MKMKKLTLAMATASLMACNATMSAADVGQNATNYINANGELMLYGVIGDWWDGNDALSVVSQLENSNPHGDLHVRIHSEGGSFLDGLAIYNALKQSDRRVVVTIDGMALSMATIIALAGDEVRMPRNAFQFLHLAESGISGNSNDLHAAAETLEQFSQQAASIYSAHSNLSEEEALALMQSNTWLNAEQCLAHGLIDSILDPVEAVAHYMDFGEREVPKGVMAMMQLPLTAAPAASLEENLEEEDPVDPVRMSAGPAAAPAAAVVPDPAAEAAMRAEGATTERTRQTELRGLATLHGLSDTVMQGWIDNGTEIAEARTAALAELAKRDTDNMPGGRAAVVTKDNKAEMKVEIREAILHRAAPGANIIEGGNEFAHMSLMEMSRKVLMLNGVDTGGMSPRNIASAVLHSTSDLPSIFADVASNEMARGYQARPRTFQQIAARRNIKNFKPQNITRLSDAPTLLGKGESGEYQMGHLTDSKETITLQTKGRMIEISREMLINDEMDALSRVPMMMGAQGALNENRTVYGLLASNPTMGETGKSLFHADHKNVITGAASFDVALLGLMRKLLRLQTSKGANGEAGYELNTPLGSVVVPASLETEAQKVVASIMATTVGDVNPFSSLNIIPEAILDGFSTKASYGIGDPTLVDGLTYGYLEGEEGVYVDSQIDFKSDALLLKVRHDFAASAADFRGLVKHNGA